MRQIKFRSWNGRDMVYEKDISHLSLEDTFVYKMAKFWCNITPDSQIMQFTGLQDKNGVDIYEGDILKMLCPYRENETTCEVIFINGGFTVEANGWFAGGEADITTVGWALESDIEIEVIGNIHTTPHLITK